MQPYGGETPLLSGSGGASGGLGAPEGDGGGGGKYSIFNLKRYRKHFNVDTQARTRPTNCNKPHSVLPHGLAPAGGYPSRVLMQTDALACCNEAETCWMGCKCQIAFDTSLRLWGDVAVQPEPGALLFYSKAGWARTQGYPRHGASRLHLQVCRRGRDRSAQQRVHVAAYCMLWMTGHIPASILCEWIP